MKNSRQLVGHPDQAARHGHFAQPTPAPVDSLYLVRLAVPAQSVILPQGVSIAEDEGRHMLIDHLAVQLAEPAILVRHLAGHALGHHRPPSRVGAKLVRALLVAHHVAHLVQ